LSLKKSETAFSGKIHDILNYAGKNVSFCGMKNNYFENV